MTLKCANFISLLVLSTTSALNSTIACDNNLKRMEPPPKQILDQVFRNAELDNDLSGFDALDRDIFYMRGRCMDITKWSSHYPSFSKEKLNKMKVILQSIHCDETKS